MPATRYEQISRFARLSNATLPDGLAMQLRTAQYDPHTSHRIGVDHATGLAQRLLDEGAPGLHYITLNDSSAAMDIHRGLRLPVPPVTGGRTPRRPSSRSRWEQVMAADPVDPEVLAGLARNARLTRFRPGHADLAGMQKYGSAEARPVLERASAWETAARVALSAVARSYLKETTGIEIVRHVVELGSVKGPGAYARRRPTWRGSTQYGVPVGLGSHVH